LRKEWSHGWVDHGERLTAGWLEIFWVHAHGVINLHWSWMATATSQNLGPKKFKHTLTQWWNILA
jgi:hypothetical protein